jgi:hypothetical protein
MYARSLKCRGLYLNHHKEGAGGYDGENAVRIRSGEISEPQSAALVGERCDITKTIEKKACNHGDKGK